MHQTRLQEKDNQLPPNQCLLNSSYGVTNFKDSMKLPKYINYTKTFIYHNNQVTIFNIFTILKVNGPMCTKRACKRSNKIKMNVKVHKIEDCDVLQVVLSNLVDFMVFLWFRRLMFA